MKQRNLAIVTLAVAVGVVMGNYGLQWLNQWRVHQLLQTRACPGCDLRYTNLVGADLTFVNLAGANLEGANLERADLRHANLSRTNLRHANLSQTSLKDANLQQANLERATLEGANLGCMAFNFNLRADDDSASFSFNLDRQPSASDRSDASIRFNLNADQAGASFRLNAFGCAKLDGANLRQTRMPDGNINS
ncbi:pentapeptide repeat-containing protein [Pantanalinema rosaneae CENA516]|uniref:pentapeptide repeat-containing protein n=1 Tax=Pantanalinema rosaneae TaxID=1620701 RepID=UPI003D6F3BC4